MNDYTDEEVPLAERVIEVPLSSIKPELLQSMLEEFVTRDGTDYGETTALLEEKVNMLLAKLQQGDLKVYYDSLSECIDILPESTINKLASGSSLQL